MARVVVSTVAQADTATILRDLASEAVVATPARILPPLGPK